MKPTDPQQAPVLGTAPHSADLVVADLAERKRHGIEKYGVAHQHDNGRDHLVDLYQELLDGCVYVRAEIQQRNDGVVAMKRELNAAHERVLHEMARASDAETRADVAEKKLSDLVLKFDSTEMQLSDTRKDLDFARVERAEVLAAQTRAEVAETRATKLEAFKTFVHKRLDDSGVPADPDPAANAQHGCRVEGRLNWLTRHMDDAVAIVGKFEQRLALANESLETEGLPRV